MCFQKAAIFKFALIVALSTVCRAQTTAPAVQGIVPEDPTHARAAITSGEALQKAIRERHRFETTVKSIGPFRLDEIIEITNRSGRLHVEIYPPTEVIETIDENRLVHVEIEKSDGFWTFARTFSKPQDKTIVTEQWSIARFDYDQQGVPEGFWFVNATTSPGGINIQNQWNEKSPVHSVNFQQDAKSAHLVVTAQANPGVGGAAILNVEAPTLGELAARHPAEVRKYFGPLLRRLTGRDLLGVGAADAYAVFDQIAPDPVVVKKFQAALAQMDAADPATRTSAAARLTDMGDAGVLTAMRADATNFSAEQRGVVEKMIGSHRHRDIGDAATARKDKLFLIDCLASDDVAVRRAAKECLEKLLDRRVEFDPAAEMQVRFRAIDALRDTFIGPSTQPKQAEPPPKPES